MAAKKPKGRKLPRVKIIKAEMVDPGDLYRSVRARPDPTRVAERLKAGDVDGNVGRRKRGDRTDADCVDEICELVSAGMTCADAREYVGVSGTQWGAWVRDNHEGAYGKYEGAKQLRVEAWADDIVKESEECSHENHRGHEVRIKVKQWLMGKHSPKYQDKVVHEGGDASKPMRVIGANMTPQEAAQAYAETVKGAGPSEPKQE